MKNSFFILLLIIILFWPLWIPGAKVAVDHAYWYREALDTFFSVPYVWRELFANGLGEPVLSSIWVWPILFIHALFSRLGLSFEILTVLLGTFPAILISFFGIYNLLKYLKVNGWPGYIGAFFYSANTYFILLLDGGQINLALAYSSIPFCFLFFKKSLTQPNRLNFLKFISFFLATSFFDIRAIFFLALLILLEYIFEVIPGKQKIKITFNYLKITSLAALVLVGIHAYWIIPTILGDTYLPSSYGRVQQLDSLSFTNLSHPIFAQHPNWFQNVFGRVFQIRAEYVILPILVFLAPIVHKNKLIAYWLTVALIGIFFTKGSNPPFGEVYSFLLKDIPGFVAFRDPSKFYFLVIISYTILLSYTVQVIINFTKKYFKKFSLFIPVLILCYLIFLIRPVFLNQMTGMFSSPPYQVEYQTLTNFLEKDNQFSRVLWIPTRAPLGYSNPNHPSVEAIYLTEKRPFASASVGIYETLNFLREAPFMGEILDVAGVGYISYPPLDIRREDPHPDIKAYYRKFLTQLLSLSWIEGKVNQSQIPLLKLKNHQDRFFAAENSWLVLGSDKIYSESTRSGKLNLSKNAIIFAEEKIGIAQKVINFKEVKIVLNNKTSLDLAASLLPENTFLFPAGKLDFKPDRSGWWKRESVDYIWLRDFLNKKYQIDNKDFDYGGGFAIAEGKLTLEIKNNLILKDKVLLIRVMESTRSAELKFLQGSNLVGKINTKAERNNFRWYEVGKLADSGLLRVESLGDINILNALSFIDEDKWLSFKNKAKEIEASGRIRKYDGGQPENRLPLILSYKQINPTKYSVKISRLTAPTFLIFSESFDPLWQLNGQGSNPVYSFINGFRVEKDGEYLVEFKPQQYAYYGMAISIITLLVLLSFFIRGKRK